MNIKKLIGYTLITSPFAAIYIVLAIDLGYLAAFIPFVAAGAIIGVIALGEYLTK